MPGGRPRKHPDDYLPQLCQALELGAWHWLACKYAGVSYSTFHRWMLAGEAADADAAMQAFVRRIRQAEATAAIRDLLRIHAAAAHDWRAAVWLLQRRYPAEYGTRVVEQRHGGDVTQAVQVVLHRADGEPGPQAGARTTAAGREGVLDADP
jgi:hypothetical protein